MPCLDRGSELFSGAKEVSDLLRATGAKIRDILRSSASLEKLKDPKIMWGEGDVLVIGDGSPDVPEETLGMNYSRAREHCLDNGLEMFGLKEYRALQSRGAIYELNGVWTWIESGANPLEAIRARGSYTTPSHKEGWWADTKSGRVFFSPDFVYSSGVISKEVKPSDWHASVGVRRKLTIKLS